MLAHRETAFGAPNDPILVDDADDGLDGFSVREVPVSPTVSRVTRTSAGSKKKDKAIPYSKPADKTRASDDEVRATEPTLKGKRRALAEDIIELTSESDADPDDGGTVRHPSPAAETSALPSTVDETPRPVIMSPSIVSPKKNKNKKPAPKKRSPVKTRSTKVDNTDLP